MIGLSHAVKTSSSISCSRRSPNIFLESPFAVDGVDDSQGCLSRDIPSGRREGRGVWTVVVYDWHHRDGGVHKGADGCRGEGDVRDGVVDCEEGNDGACQGEETEM
jgi:hypothetical protein